MPFEERPEFGHAPPPPMDAGREAAAAPPVAPPPRPAQAAVPPVIPVGAQSVFQGRLHPLTLVFAGWAFLRSFLIPIVVLVFFGSRREGQGWMLFGLMGVGIPLGLAMVRYFTFTYRIDAGELPDFLPETAHIRAGDWKVAPLPPDLLDRRVEITGPTERKTPAAVS